MNSFATVLLVSLAFAVVQGYGCGGLLEGDAGQLEFPIEGNAGGESNCLWIIKLISGSGIRFTLNRIGAAGVLSLYPEHEATETVLNPIRLDTTTINSTVLTNGQVLVVVLAKSSFSTGIEFTWESDAINNSPIARAANYLDTPEGRVSWTKFGQQERLTWGLGVDPSKTLTIRTVTDFSRCEAIDPCQCSYFAVYEVTPEGYLREATRVCGRPSQSKIEQLYSQLVAFVYVNSTATSPAGSVEITWIASGSEDPTTTNTPTTTTTTTPNTATTTMPTTTTTTTTTTTMPTTTFPTTITTTTPTITFPTITTTAFPTITTTAFPTTTTTRFPTTTTTRFPTTTTTRFPTTTTTTFPTTTTTTFPTTTTTTFPTTTTTTFPTTTTTTIPTTTTTRFPTTTTTRFPTTTTTRFPTTTTTTFPATTTTTFPATTTTRFPTTTTTRFPTTSTTRFPTTTFPTTTTTTIPITTTTRFPTTTFPTTTTTTFPTTTTTTIPITTTTTFPTTTTTTFPTTTTTTFPTTTTTTIPITTTTTFPTTTTTTFPTTTTTTFPTTTTTTFPTTTTTTIPTTTTTRFPTTTTTRFPTTTFPTTTTTTFPTTTTTTFPTTTTTTFPTTTTLTTTTATTPTTTIPTTTTPATTTTTTPTTTTPATTTTTTFSTTTPTTTLAPTTPSTDIDLECGGIITVTTSSEVTVRYKLNERYNNGEFCVWGLKPNSGLGWSQVTVELLEDGFNPGQDGLEAYYDQEATTELTSLSRCTFNSATRSCTLRNGMGFIAFSSNIIGDGTGFRAKISMGDANELESSANFYSTIQGNLSYPANGGSYSYSERHLDVLQVNALHTVHINSVHTEKNYDTVSLYSLDRYGSNTNFRLEGRWSGDLPDGEAADLPQSLYPRVVIFKSDSSSSYSGYNLAWRQLGSRYRGHLLQSNDRLTRGSPLPLSELLKLRA